MKTFQAHRKQSHGKPTWLALLAMMGGAVLAIMVAAPSRATAQSTRPPSSRPLPPPGSHRGPPLPNSTTDNQRALEDLQRKSKAAQDRLRQRGVTNAGGMTTRSEPPPFNAASAPPPDECLKAFVAAGRTATSMDQLTKFLPQREMELLKSSEASYDPKEAASKQQWFRQQNPKITDESLAHLTSSPYASALKFKKSLASDIRDILSVKVEGNKANLVVSTNKGATINDVHYPYGKADVEMIGEGNYWKLSGFHQSIVYYKDPPTTP